MPSNDHQVKKWRDVLWREWRNCRNTSYAEQLFELVADTPIGWGTRFTFISLDAVIGIVIGLLIGFVVTTEWAILRQLVLAGAVVGAVRGGLASYHLHWRDWLARLSFSLPTQAPHSRLLIVGILMLIPTVIFGPFLWFLIIGLFWGMGGLLKWMNKSLRGEDIFSYYAWYFWWRPRPALDEVLAALEWAAEAGLPRPAPPQKIENPLDPAPTPVEVNFHELQRFARRRDVPPVSAR